MRKFRIVEIKKNCKWAEEKLRDDKVPHNPGGVDLGLYI